MIKLCQSDVELSVCILDSRAIRRGALRYFKKTKDLLRVDATALFHPQYIKLRPVLEMRSALSIIPSLA